MATKESSRWAMRRLDRISPARRNVLIGLALVTTFFFFQFSREVSRGLSAFFYRFLSIEWVGEIVFYIQEHIGYNIYHPRFWTKVVVSGLAHGLTFACIRSYAHTGREARFGWYLVSAALIAAMLLNVLGKAISNQWMETLSRDSFEFIFSPLPAIFCVPVMYLYRATRNQ